MASTFRCPSCSATLTVTAPVPVPVPTVDLRDAVLTLLRDSGPLAAPAITGAVFATDQPSRPQRERVRRVLMALLDDGVATRTRGTWDRDAATWQLAG